ncbi:YbhB/YbcL family Raf kinase inhibitor-like protein [Glaciibacter psychrotolerans]|uniref:YbhB/YbcL family Raf kinase inhibitor-like protein n=1 Tax=Glaciibacter psychrotolerans TaxID=670054 RepID=A0A7Z0J7F6_9MICO|nr:YbhB/YbcL family Raf kinase inhibitor-like protein [Leifsonia psychrotolerans]NYJ20903.1 hypothetical protein [Leifsonia psychrotolerans]
MTDDPLARFKTVPLFTLTSTDFVDGGPLALPQYEAAMGGQDRSPQLSWSGFPNETRSFALTCYDPDAPTGSGFWHWAVFNLPASTTHLDADAGAPDSALMPAGAVTLPNEARLSHYIGSGPPAITGVHRYQYIVHALDLPTLDLDPQSTPGKLGFTLFFHTLARGVLQGTAKQPD